MKNIFILTFTDPVMLVCFLVFAGTAALLLWAIRSMKNPGGEAETTAETPETEENKTFSDENQEVVGARLHEISSQLCELNQKIADIEKNRERMLQAGGAASMDVSQLQNDGAAKLSETLERLEAKLDGILKLLVHLTDSSSDQK
jgi:hypothetical protein